MQPAPMTAEQYLRLDNVMKGRSPPEALRQLRSSNSFTITGAGDLAPDPLIRPIEGLHGARSYRIVEGRHRVMRGLPVRERHRLRREDLRTESPTLPLPPPRIPEWSDRIYHPKMSAGLARPTLRRIKGRRLRPLYLFGGDRQPFFPSGYPWQCIGRIFAWADPYSFAPSWTASGVLVSHNAVLTASHAVPWAADPAMIQFIPAYFQGGSTLGPDVYAWVDAASAYYQEPSPEPDVAAWDFAVLRLSDPLGESLGWFGGKTYDDGWNDGNYWSLVGYPGDVAGGEQPSWQGGGSFHDDDEDGDAKELETDDLDATPGDSGGPVFGFWDGESWPSVVGVVSGQEEEWNPFPEDNNVAAAGAAMIDLIRWAQQSW